MNLQDFSLLGEDNDSYKIGHPKGKSMRVPKAGMSKKAHEIISKLKKHQNFDEGGTPDSDVPINLSGQLMKEDETPPGSYINYGDAQLPSQLPAQSNNEEIPVNTNAAVTPQMEAAASGNQPAPTSSGAPPSTGFGGIGSTYNNAPLYQAQKDIKEGAEAEELAGLTQADAFSDAADQIKQSQAQFNQRFQDYQAKDDQFSQQLLNNKIDPNRLWNNASTGSKIAASLGLILSGAGSAVAHQPNAALGLLNTYINNDIAAQMNEQNKTMNLWKMNREALGNDRDATLATQNQLLNVAKIQAMQAQAFAQGDLAKARIAPTILGIQQQIQQNNRTKSLFDMANTPAASGRGGLSNVDPSQLVETLVPPERRQKVYDEIQAAQDTKRMSGSIMNAFDQAARDNTVLKTGGGLLRTPASVYSLHQAMQPTFKDLEGTVRQAAMDNTFKNITPMPGDLDSTIQTKRQALSDYLRSKESAPVAKGNHLDLSRFQSTAASQGGRYAPDSVINVKGRGQFRVGPDGNSLVPT
jgi:hypothetical protein